MTKIFHQFTTNLWLIYLKDILRDHAATNLNICCTEKFALWFWVENQKLEVFLAYQDHFYGFRRPFWAILGRFHLAYPK